jgi:hypothetical protein
LEGRTFLKLAWFQKWSLSLTPAFFDPDNMPGYRLNFPFYLAAGEKLYKVIFGSILHRYTTLGCFAKARNDGSVPIANTG